MRWRIYFGWRTAFVVTGVFGLCWVFAWRRIATDLPTQNARVGAAERCLIADDRERMEAGECQAEANTRDGIDGIARHDVPDSRREREDALADVPFWRRPQVYIMAFSLFCCSYNQFFFLSWFPIFLVDQKHLSLAQMSVASSFPWLVGALGYVLGGLLIDFVFKKTGNLILSRKLVLVLFLAIGGLCVAWSGQVASTRAAVSIMSLAIGCIMLTSTAYWALIPALVPKNAVGGASGLMHGLGNLSGIIGPALTGWIVQSTHNYGTAFTIAGALAMLGALAVGVLIRHHERA